MCNLSLKSVSLQEGWKLGDVTTILEKVPRSECRTADGHGGGCAEQGRRNDKEKTING